MKSLARCVLLLAAVAPALSQSENEPYFALSSHNTFATNGKPSVDLSGINVESVEIRVYRVQDPIQFFQQIDDPHRFGGGTPVPPRKRTMLERMHSWKRGLRAGIRRSLRAQFSEPPHEHLNILRPAEKAPAPAERGTHYAEAPLLNPQQLVLTFQQPVRGENRWDRQNVPLAVNDKGVYLVEAVRGELRAYTILIVSDIVLITKTGRGRVVNLVVDRNTGEPIRDVRVAMITRDSRGESVATDANGTAEMKVAAGPHDDVRVVARRGADIAVNTLASYAFRANGEDWRGYIYTDRPVYRPGHTVHFKAIFRLRTIEGYNVPAGRKVKFEIRGPEDKPVYQKELAIGTSGAVHDDFVLSPDTPLGNYFMEARMGEESMSGNFEVQDYKKPEYEVRFTPSKGRVLQGESVTGVIDARYYFGEPVNGAKVQYAVYRDRYWFPLWYDPEEATAGPDEGDSDEPGDQVSEGEGELDSQGKLTVKIDTALSDHKFDYVYRVEARITDQAKREITGKGWFLATYGSFVLNASPDRYFYAPGGRAAIKVEARDYDSKPVQTRVHVELLLHDWRDASRDRPRGSTDAETGADGTGMAYLTLPSEGGSYRVKLTARTPEGRDVENDDYLFISGGGQDRYFTRTENELQIVTDKKTYQAGETARLLIMTGRANTPVYVSVEGRDLRQLKLLRSKEATTLFEVPVSASDEPGITVSASFVRKGVLHMGQKYVRVPPATHQLNVRLATDKPQYQPGQIAEYSIDVSGSDGQPVPRAEFSLGVVDEAIYAVRKDSTQDILGFFFGREWNAVYTDNSLTYYFTGEAGKRRMRLAELRPPSKLAQLKPDRLVQPKIRKAFPDTAFWSADLVTDGAGHARARVEFPDSLTTWRATARGITPDTKAGSSTLKTIVRKNLILRLAVPRFFVQGDEVTISALVHNYLPTDKKARVSLDVTGLDVLEGGTKDVDVPSRGEAKVDWRVRAKQVRSATVIGKALTNEESDGLQLDLPVNIPGVKLAHSSGGSLAAGSSTTFDLTFPPNIAPGSRSLAVKLSPSVAGTLFNALEYLITYPYGCVEQTMSSFLPNIVVTQTVRDLGLKVNLDQASTQEKIRAGLERLYDFQHEDGGWGWWENDETHPFMTAYVVAGLAQAKAAGVQVKDESIENGANWLKNNLAQNSKVAPDLRAYMIYALTVSGKGDAALLKGLNDRRTGLSPYGLALLGLALEQSGQAPAAAEVAVALESAAQQDGEQAWWPAARDEMLDFTADVTPEATAYAVKFLSHQRRDSALLPKAAVWLMNHRNEGYWWTSTKQTAMVIYGLTDLVKATGELNPDLNVTVFVNDRPGVTRKLEAAAGLTAPDLLLDETALSPGANHIRITTNGRGRLYYAARAEYYSTDEKLQNTGTTSLNILREYFRLVASRDGEKIVYDTAPLNGPVAPGDTIAVRLTVSGSEWKYMMIEDPIPAGTEFIERDNSYQLRNRPPWWQYLFSRRELHDDRVAMFQTWFSRGQQEYFYLLKVVNPGVFQVSPARVQPMYQTGVLATTEARRLEVK